MHSSTVAIALLTCASLGLCAPAGKLSKRNMCTLIGYNAIYQDVFDGGVGTPTTSSGFELYYVGGVKISSSTYERGGTNPIKSGVITTIQETELHTAENIGWKPNFNLFTFEGCWATYEGQSVNGYLHGAINPCDTAGPGWDCSYCSVDFQCEGNLPAPN